MIALLALLACSRAPVEAPEPGEHHADVEAVRTAREPGELTFSVTVRSPDTGCDRYADWWEVLDGGGSLLYRRILLHSHPDEQPFTRSGGPVPVEPGQEVLVRAHLSTTGYGGQVLRGVPGGPWEPATDLDPGWAARVEDEPPQPGACAF